MSFPQMIRCFTCVLGLVLVADLASADVPDQVSTCSSEAGSNISLMLPIGQTFQPSQAELDAVEFNFQGYGMGSAMVTLNVRQDTLDGTVVGSESVNVTMVFDVDQWVRFDFDPPLSLTVDSTYMLELVTATNTIGLLTACSYDRGTLWPNGVEFPIDTEFRTFGPCGNGDLDAGEQCDDETFQCCDFPSCELTPIDTECQADGNECTLDTCDGAGTCVSVNAPVETACTQDADPCIVEVCNGFGACVGLTNAIAGTVCELGGSLCSNDACDGSGTCALVIAPDPSCSTASSASLALEDSSKPGKDSVKFKWKKGPEDSSGAGNPDVDTTYALCVYDGLSALVADGELPGTPAWVAKGDTKLVYKDKEGLTDNVTGGQVVDSNDALSMSMNLGGAGLALNLGTELDAPVTAQIRTSTGGCFGGAFDTADIKKNDGGKFIAKEKN